MKTRHILLATVALFAATIFTACSTIVPTPAASDTAMICGPGTANPSVSAPAAPPAPTVIVPSASPAPVTAWSKIKGWFVSAEKSPEVVATKAEAAKLLKTFVFTGGEKMLTGANWADAFSAAIYADETAIINDPTQLNAMLGPYLPANSQWTPVVDGLVSKLLSGQLNTKAQRIAAVEGIAATLTTTAATARAQ